MIYKDNPMDEDLMNCDDFEMYSLSEYNSCIYRRKCEVLQFRKLINDLKDAKTKLAKGD